MYTMKTLREKPTTIRFTHRGKRLLELLAEKMGISQSAVIEVAIRKLAEIENVKE